MTESTSQNIGELKKKLRKEFLLKRSTVSDSEKYRISHQLVKKIRASGCYRSSKIIMAYSSMKNEIQLDEFFEVCFRDKKILTIPFIISKGVMKAVIVPSFEALEIGKFNIRTVRNELRSFIDVKNINLIIVPGLAFDLECNRLGLGGGYYDKFLSQAIIAKKIALAYNFQLVKKLPSEIHDVKLDMILTESEEIER